VCGEDHAKFVQLSIEYDPHPPFDCGSPDKVNAATLAKYKAMVATRFPDRDAVVRGIAERSGA
jgi:cyclohexyl-isocyanide hydratase